MIFYEIQLQSVPQFLFACSVDLKNYQNRIHNLPNFLELALCEAGRIFFEYDDGSQEITLPGMLIPCFSSMSFCTKAYQNEHQRHTTVGLSVQYTWKRWDSAVPIDITALRDRVSNGALLIPYHCLLGDIHAEVLRRLKKAIHFIHSGGPCGSTRAISEVYTLLAMLTEFVLREIDDPHTFPSPAERNYVENILQYIHDNYRKYLTVAELAEHAGLSQGYLHRIFRKATGTGILEYINRYRVEMVIELVHSRNLSLAEAAFSVGIEDPAYMSRLFKKVTGLSFREYFRQTNMVTD